MSWRHAQAAGQLPLKRAAVKAVLNTLAHHANDFTGHCWPSIERIMLFTSLTRRTVQGALRELERDKLITTKRGGGKLASVYTLTLPDCEPVAQGGAAPARGGAADSGRGAGRAPQTSRNDDRNDAREATPLPDDWSPPREAVEWAQQQFTTVDIENETELFIDQARTKGETYVDAIAAWKVWIRRGEAFAKRDQQREQSRGASRGAGSKDGAARLRQAASRSGGRRAGQG